MVGDGFVGIDMLVQPHHLSFLHTGIRITYIYIVSVFLYTSNRLNATMLAPKTMVLRGVKEGTFPHEAN